MDFKMTKLTWYTRQVLAAIFMLTVLFIACARELPHSPYTQQQLDSLIDSIYNVDTLNNFLYLDTNLNWNDYFPLQVGNRWVYLNASGTGHKVTHLEELLINEKQEITYRFIDSLFDRIVKDSIFILKKSNLEDSIIVTEITRFNIDTTISTFTAYDTTHVIDTLIFKDSLFSLKITLSDSEWNSDTMLLNQIDFNITHIINSTNYPHQFSLNFLDSIVQQGGDTLFYYLTRRGADIKDSLQLDSILQTTLGNAFSFGKRDTQNMFFVQQDYIDTLLKITQTFRADTLVIADTVYNFLDTIQIKDTIQVSRDEFSYYLPSSYSLTYDSSTGFLKRDGPRDSKKLRYYNRSYSRDTSWHDDTDEFLFIATVKKIFSSISVIRKGYGTDTTIIYPNDKVYRVTHKTIDKINETNIVIWYDFFPAFGIVQIQDYDVQINPFDSTFQDVKSTFNLEEARINKVRYFFK